MLSFYFRLQIIHIKITYMLSYSDACKFNNIFCLTIGCSVVKMNMVIVMEGNIRIEIGKRISAALAARNMRQKDLAQAIGVKDNVISFFCSGTRVPNAEQIIGISIFLNVSSDYLLGLTDNMTTDKDLDSVCNYVGLGEAAIKELHQYQKDGITYPHKLIDLLANSKSSYTISLYINLLDYLTSEENVILLNADENFDLSSDTLKDDVLFLKQIKEIITIRRDKRNPGIKYKAVDSDFLQSLYLLSMIEDLAQIKKDLSERK